MLLIFLIISVSAFFLMLAYSWYAHRRARGLPVLAFLPLHAKIGDQKKSEDLR